MNVLILTPDAVGSTLLQRLLTIYMQFHDFDRPVINLHELTNGLEKYWSPDFGCEIVSKSRVQNWGYYQTLQQIVEILGSVDHYKTSRLAHYHIRNRRDTIAEQIPFYRYLDENFFVIACRRANVFEHAVSMTLNRITKRLNVYDHKDKIDTFLDLYVNKVSLDLQALTDQLDAYKSYMSWASDHFNISSFFHYEQQVPEIEKYILGLPVFARFKQTVTWQDKFDMSFNDWNRCHRIPSDIGAVALSDHSSLMQLSCDHKTQNPDVLTERYKKDAFPEWPSIQDSHDYQNLPAEIKQQFLQISYPEMADYLPQAITQFYQAHRHNYQRARAAIDVMQKLDIIISSPPIKKQSFEEKIHMIKNWRECLDIYNEWIDRNPGIGTTLSEKDFAHQMIIERDFWHANARLATEALGTQNVQKLANQSDDRL